MGGLKASTEAICRCAEWTHIEIKYCRSSHEYITFVCKVYLVVNKLVTIWWIDIVIGDIQMNPTATTGISNIITKKLSYVCLRPHTRHCTQDDIFVEAPVFASSRTPNHPIRQLRTSSALLPVIAIFKLPTSLVQLQINLLQYILL